MSSKSKSKKKSRSRSKSASPHSESHLTPYFTPENEENQENVEVPLAPGPVNAPESKRDPRYLDEGSSKMVWLMVPNANRNRLGQPRDKQVVVNAFDRQLFRRGFSEAILQRRMDEQRNEYEFTRMLKGIFPDLIPGVYPLDIHIDPHRFRYTKDRCLSMPKNERTFSIMVRMIDMLNEDGWAYLDMKPGNLGGLDGNVVLLDTDPHCFYMIPYPPSNKIAEGRIRKYYRECCHIIVVLFCFKHVPEIPIEFLQRFLRSKIYSQAYLHRLYDQVAPSERNVAEFSNAIYERLGHPIRLIPDKVQSPKVYIDHYGQLNGVHPLTRLAQILEHGKGK